MVRMTLYYAEVSKFGPTQFKAEVEKLQREGRMPSLERLLEVIAETRAEYREKILAARRSRKP
jgi:hypothetical protein